MKVDNLIADKEYSINKLKKRIYYAETDAGGIVYYANLCKYIEAGCSEWFRKFGIPFSELTKEYGLFFVMKDVHLHYKIPIKYDEEIVCYCAENTMVPVDIKTKKPMKIPDKLLNKITERTDITIC